MLDRAFAGLAVACLALAAQGCGAAADSPAAPSAAAGAPSPGPAGAGPNDSGPAGSAPIDVPDADVALLKKSRVAVKLADGRVLAAGGDEDVPGPAGSAQIFDPKTGRWSEVGALHLPRIRHALVALADGKALVCGGEDMTKMPTPIPVTGKPVDACEIFDPATNRFAAAPPMHAPRRRFTMTRLADGRVLAVGDPGSEIFDPQSGNWGVSLQTAVPYLGHTASLLQDGRVLVIGVGGTPLRASAETFGPHTSTWTVEPPPPQGVMDHTATVMQDGSVLIAGGQAPFGGIPRPVNFAAVFEPKHERWNVTGQPHVSHWRHGALLLPNGDVVVAGGATNDAELYAHESWKDLPPSLDARLGLRLKSAVDKPDPPH